MEACTNQRPNGHIGWFATERDPQSVQAFCVRSSQQRGDRIFDARLLGLAEHLADAEIWSQRHEMLSALLGLAEASALADWNVLRPVSRLTNAARKKGIRLDDQNKRSLTAGLIQFLPRRIDFGLPTSVLSLYSPVLSSLLAFLESGSPYDDEAFAKDLRFLSGVSAPMGAQFADVRFAGTLLAQVGSIKRATFNAGRLAMSGAPILALEHLRQSSLKQWVQIHTDTRYLGEFNPEGWTATYRRIADVLAGRPELAGLLGISWFYDPRIKLISPRLRYLSELPLANGAYLIKLRATKLDRERASATSETRRRLIETGEYVPRSFALFWPRSSLLKWAKTAPQVAMSPFQGWR